jgi:hypothetical protein
MERIFLSLGGLYCRLLVSRQSEAASMIALYSALALYAVAVILAFAFIFQLGRQSNWWGHDSNEVEE